MSNQDHASYLRDFILPNLAPATIEKYVAVLRTLEPFDAIAVTGVSGMLVGVPLMHKLGKPLVIVRKEEEPRTHSHIRVEGYSVDFKRYVIVDDCVSSGKTVGRIIGAMRRPPCAVVAGAHLTDGPLSYALAQLGIAQ